MFKNIVEFFIVNDFVYNKSDYRAIIIGILLRAPIENINHPLSDRQKNINQKIVRVIVGIDFTLLMVFCINRMTMASYQMVFIILNGLTFGIGQMENYIISKER